MNIREISVSRLRDYENNPRNNDLAVEKVKYSIERFGFLFPVVVDMNYTIVAGHTRVRACREMGIQTVPVSYTHLSTSRACFTHARQSRRVRFLD